MHDDDPVLLQYNAFRAEFGRDERIAVAIKSDKIFTLEFLNTLKALHEEIEAKVPYVDDVCKKRTKPATLRAGIRPLLVPERDFISA